MGTKTFNNYEDLLTFTRASKGHALRPVSYGSELVTNGGFDTDSDWTKLGGSTISSGEGHIASTGSFVSLNQDIGAVTGKIYFVTIDVTVNSGSGVYIGIGGGAIDSRRYDATFTGTHSFALVAGNVDTNVQITRAGPTDSDVDNISVKEVTFDQPDGTLTLFEHPNNIPRVEWDAQRNRLGLLVEEARTNLFARSDAKEWTVSGGGTTTINTDLTLGAFTGAIRASGGQDWHRMYAPYVSVTSGTTYTITAFFKYGTSNNVLLNFRDTAGSQESRIIGSAGNLTNSLTNAGTVTILQEEALPNAVRKVVVKYVPDFSGSFEFGIGPNSTTSGETVIPLAAQCEQASFGTSYVKTTGATATRSVDIASINTADFGYNSAEGTVVCEFNIKYDDGGSGFPRVWEIGNNASSADRINTYIAESNGNLAVGINTNTTAQAGSTLKTNTGGSVESTVAMGWARDDFGVSDDGDTALTDSDIDILPTAFSRNQLKIGGAANTVSDNISGHIKSIKYYPRKLTNAQLQDLSS